MKKLMIYSTAILMMLSVITLKAQEGNKTAMNSMKSLKKSETKTERKEVRKEDRNLVSDISMEAFGRDFENVSDVSWEKDSFFDIAMFNKDGHSYKAFYGRDSKLAGTTTVKTFADLPKDAQKEIKKQFGNYTIDKVVYFENNQSNNNDMLLYGTQFEGADNYFVEMSGNNKNIVVQVNPEGQVFFFKELQKRV